MTGRPGRVLPPLTPVLGAALLTFTAMLQTPPLVFDPSPSPPPLDSLELGPATLGQKIALSPFFLLKISSGEDPQSTDSRLDCTLLNFSCAIFFLKKRGVRNRFGCRGLYRPSKEPVLTPFSLRGSSPLSIGRRAQNSLRTGTFPPLLVLKELSFPDSSLL